MAHLRAPSVLSVVLDRPQRRGNRRWYAEQERMVGDEDEGVATGEEVDVDLLTGPATG